MRSHVGMMRLWRQAETTPPRAQDRALHSHEYRMGKMVRMLQLVLAPMAKEIPDDKRDDELPFAFGDPRCSQQELLDGRMILIRQDKERPLALDCVTACAEVTSSADLMRHILCLHLGLRHIVVAGSVSWTWRTIGTQLQREMAVLEWTTSTGRPDAFRRLDIAMTAREGKHWLGTEDSSSYSEAWVRDWLWFNTVGLDGYMGSPMLPGLHSDLEEDCAQFEAPCGAALLSNGDLLVAMSSCYQTCGALERSTNRHVEPLLAALVHIRTEPNLQRVGDISFRLGPFYKFDVSAVATTADTDSIFLVGHPPLPDRPRLIKLDQATLVPTCQREMKKSHRLVALAVHKHGAASRVVVCSWVGTSRREAPSDYLTREHADSFDYLSRVLMYEEVGACFERHRAFSDAALRAELIMPTGMAVAAGQLVICDFAAHCLVVADPATGAIVRVVGGPGRSPGRFDGPCAICAASSHAFVAESLARRVQVLSSATLEPLQVLRMAGAGLLSSISADHRNCFVTDAARDQVHTLRVMRTSGSTPLWDRVHTHPLIDCRATCTDSTIDLLTKEVHRTKMYDTDEDRGD